MAAAAAFLVLPGTAAAQGLQVVEKPAPSRFYGTARPPGAPGGPSGPAIVAPAPGGGFRQPGTTFAPPASVYVPPPVVRPVAPVYGYRPAPRVGITVGPAWYGGSYWYGPRYYGYPGWGWGGYPPPVYGPPIYAPPAVIVSPPAPTVYVERPPEPAPLQDAAPLPGYWYWCAQPQGWYPDVGECPAGWQAVPPRAAQ